MSEPALTVFEEQTLDNARRRGLEEENSAVQRGLLQDLIAREWLALRAYERKDRVWDATRRDKKREEQRAEQFDALRRPLHRRAA